MGRLPIALGAALAAFAVAGCQGASISDVTLPGGATSSDVFGTKPTNNYTVMFRDALDLVPQSSVRMNDVNVGDVRTIVLSNGQAKVDIRVLKSVTVPANIQGVLSQSSLLGEKFVDLVVPDGGPAQGALPPMSTIPTDKTSDELQVEDVFGALSELLNGGGIQQLQSISSDLDQLLTHRESSLRDLLSQFTVLTGSLDARRDEIVRALNALNTLSVTLKAQQGVIKEALSDISPGLVALNDSRGDIIKLLHSLTSLGSVATRVEKETQADTVSDLRTLQPTLDRLNQAGNNIVNSLELLVTFPFGDNALKAIFSDYTGLYATLNIDLRNGSTANPLGANGLCGAAPSQSTGLCSVLTMLGSALPGTGTGSLPTPTLPLPLPGVNPTQSSSVATAGTPAATSTSPATTSENTKPLLSGLVPSPADSAAPTPAPSATPADGLVGGVVGGVTGGSK